MSEAEQTESPPEPPELERKKISSKVRDALAGAWAWIKSFERYYRKHLGQIWNFAVETLPFLEVTGDREREVRIHVDDPIGAQAWDGESWNIQLADSCVVCGDEADTEWIEETRHLDDVRWALWAPAIGILVGTFLAFFFPAKYSIVVGLLIGMAVGYEKRSTVKVRLRYRRDQRHAKATHVPSVTVFPDLVLLRVGTRAAKQKFVRLRQEKSKSSLGGSAYSIKSAPGGGESAIPAAGSEATEPPKQQELPPIPFDEESTD